MDEERINADEVSLGLADSDTEDYNVNDGIPDLSGEFSVGKDARERAARRRAGLTGFAGGIAFCLAVALILSYALELGKIVPKAKYDYYRELDEEYGKYYEIMKMIGEDPLAKNEFSGIDDDELKEIVAETGDPYAEYFTADEYEEFEKRYVGDYVGIGVGVVQDGDDIVIKSVFEDSPAEDAGIQSEDVIIKVDGVEPSDVDEALDMISGEAGTRLTLTIRRGEEEMELTLNRARIETDSVAYKELSEAPGVGYIRIASFRKGTDDDFKLAVRDLEAKGCDRFIIDLRDNGGGLTDVSIEIADYLLPSCRIMSEATKDGKETIYNSKASSADLDCVVLVNENTASASEILTAALKDNGACTVIGTKTYGKGVTQISHRFSDGSAVKLTATEYFTPKGNKVNGIGITPDITAEGDEAFDEALRVLSK